MKIKRSANTRQKNSHSFIAAVWNTDKRVIGRALNREQEALSLRASKVARKMDLVTTMTSRCVMSNGIETHQPKMDIEAPAHDAPLSQPAAPHNDANDEEWARFLS